MGKPTINLSETVRLKVVQYTAFTKIPLWTEAKQTCFCFANLREMPKDRLAPQLNVALQGRFVNGTQPFEKPPLINEETRLGHYPDHRRA